MAKATSLDQDFQASYGKAIARAWTDVDYKAKLLSDPRSALAEVGIELPADVSVTVKESTADQLNLVLPPPPQGEITDEALQLASGGACGCAAACHCDGPPSQ